MTAPAQIGHVEAQARGTGPDHPTRYEWRLRPHIACHV